MMKETKINPLTKRDLVEATGCPPYLIAYYTQCGYLPLIKRSSGPGHPNIFDPRAIEVITKRMLNRNHISGPLVDNKL